MHLTNATTYEWKKGKNHCIYIHSVNTYEFWCTQWCTQLQPA
jgi:hypothetical protein